MKSLASQNTFDKIRKYYTEEGIKLSSELEQVRKRWAAAFAHLLEEFHTDKDVAALMVKEFNISDAQAYRDIANAKAFFGDVRKSVKEAERYIASEMAKEMYQLAKKQWKLNKKAAYFNCMIEQQKIHYKINMLYLEDPDLPDPEKLKPSTQVLQLGIDFLQSEFVNYIDPKAKEEINKVLDRIKNILEKSVIKDYLNVKEIPFIEVKEDDH